MSRLKAATDCLYATLVEAQKLRPQREDTVNGPYGLECGWAVYERACMHERVNEIRADRGLSPITQGDVDRVERQAMGHSDYSRKFAFYCAELADEKGLVP